MSGVMARHPAPPASGTPCTGRSSTTKEWINVAAGIGKCTFREGQEIKIDLDRARLVTRAYRETEGQPWAIRRAKAVEKLCDEMPIFIKPGELIVGDANGAPDEIRWYPETSAWWMPEGVTTGGFSADGKRGGEEGDRRRHLRVLEGKERGGSDMGRHARVHTATGSRTTRLEPRRAELRREPHPARVRL